MQFDDIGIEERFDLAEPIARGSDSALRALIASAFADVSLGAGALSVHGQQQLCDGEDRKSATGDARRHWSDYTTAELETCTGALTCLPPASFRFYLPAFMASALDLLSRPIWETGLPGAVLFNLALVTDDRDWSARTLARFRALNPRQCDAVRAFLDHVCNHPQQEPIHNEDAVRALRSYWNLPELAQCRLGTPGLSTRAPVQRVVTNKGIRQPLARKPMSTAIAGP